MSKTTDSLTSTCVLCCQGIKIYAIGPCNHHICFKCSTKMRVICSQMYCAVCRTEMPKAIFTSKLHPFDGIISHKFPNDRKSGIFFATTRIQEEYQKILAHKCSICGIKREPDNSLKKLQDHMRKEHELFSCQLCVDNIKVLSSERKFYTRKELAHHRRSGDPDDTSYRGHPLCEFCDERYFDNDELLRHLRKDHFFCHFCEKDGVTNQFYGEYEDLEDHFRCDHYLCEEDKCCHEKFLAAFRTDIDLKAHKAKHHSGNMTKSQARQTRQVDVEINLPSRQRDYQRGHRDGAYGGGARGGGARGGKNRYQRDRNERDTEMAIETSLDTAQKEDSERKQERKKKMVVKYEKEERRTRGIGGGRPDSLVGAIQPKRDPRGIDHGRPDSPVGAIQPKRDTRNQFKAEEDKENEILKPGGAVIPATNNLISNIEKKAPDIADFPTLAEPATAFQMGGRWSSAPRQTQEDFPTLGNGDSAINNAPMSVAASFGFYSSLHSNKVPPTASTRVEPSQTASVGANEDAEFPTLSSIASLLGGNQKKNKTKKNKNKQPQSHSASQDSKVINYSSVIESSKETKREKRNASAKMESTLHKPAVSVPSQPTTIISSSKTSSVSSDSSNARPPPGFAAFPALSSSNVRAPPPALSSSNNRAPPPALSSSNVRAPPPALSSSNVRAPPPALSSSNVRAPPPALSSSNIRAPPPALSSSNLRAPPPALSSSNLRAPPPGFSSSSGAQAPPPGFSFATSTTTGPEFVLPPNFKQRNRDLAAKIQDFFFGDNELFSQFKQDSGEFRRSTISARDYYWRCMQTLSEDNFHSIFNELVTLLPDLVKQQDLLAVHNDYKATKSSAPKDTVLKISNTKPSNSGSKAAWKASTGKGESSSVCSVCSQVVLSRDLAEHMNVHEDFPALSSNRSASRPGPTTAWSGPTWGRGK